MTISYDIDSDDQFAAGRLIQRALRPDANPVRNDEYRLLIDRYLDRLEFRTVVDSVAAGLGLQILNEVRQGYSQEITLDYLQSNGLLPPLRDIRVLIDYFADNGVSAHPGWEYLSHIASSDHNQVHAYIKKHPGVVAGILVRDEHFERAKNLLQQSKELSFPLDTPVVIVSRSTALNVNGNASLATMAERFVFGPTSNAHFDKNEAKVKETELEILLDKKRLQMEDVKQNSTNIRDVADRLEKFIKQYPQEWFQRQQSELCSLEEDLKSHQTQLDNLQQEQLDCRKTLEELRNRLNKLNESVLESDRSINRIEIHREQCGDRSHLIKLEKDIKLAQNELQKSQAMAIEQDKLSTTAENQARRCKDEARRLESNAHSDEQEIRNIEHLKGKYKPTIGDVDKLREAHKQLCDRINKKTDGNRLQQKLEQARNALQSNLTRFKEELDEALTEAEVRNELLVLPDKSIVRQKHDEADKWERSYREKIGGARANTEIAKSELEAHKDEYPDLKIVLEPEDQNLSEKELEQSITQAKNLAKTYREQAGEQKKKASEYSKQNVSLESQKRLVRSYHRRVEQAVSDEQLFHEITAIEASTAFAPPTSEQCEAYITGIEKKLANERTVKIQLLAKRQKIWRGYLKCLEDKPFDFAKALRQWSEEQLEQEIEQLLDDLDTRENAVRSELAKIDEHRDILIIEVLRIANLGVQILRSLANNSKLPDSAGLLARKPFLKIEMKKSTSSQEERQKIGELIDDIIAIGKEIPNGIELIQRAVRKLSQPIRVKVLFPDEDAPANYISINDMSKESGGERLTSAVLLYCALAQQRAKERGRKLKISGSLLLDNPVGSASRTKLLELQRVAAQSMNIQLIYATGVNDLEALRVMPNIVRLRNERRNADNHCLLEVTHLARPEDNYQGANES